MSGLNKTIRTLSSCRCTYMMPIYSGEDWWHSSYGWLSNYCRGRNSGSPVARGYQILLWAARKKSSISPLGYQTLWLHGRENQQSAVRICINHLPVLPTSASLQNWHTLQIAALDVSSSKLLCRMFDKYRHCNCWLVALPVASTEAISTADYGFVWSLFSHCLLYAPTYTCQDFNCQCQISNPTRDLQPTFSDVVPCENLAVPPLSIIAESRSGGMNEWWIRSLLPTTNQQWCLV